MRCTLNDCVDDHDDETKKNLMQKTIVVWPKRIKCMNFIQSIRESNRNDTHTHAHLNGKEQRRH